MLGQAFRWCHAGGWSPRFCVDELVSALAVPNGSVPSDEASIASLAADAHGVRVALADASRPGHELRMPARFPAAETI